MIWWPLRVQITSINFPGNYPTFSPWSKLMFIHLFLHWGRMVQPARPKQDGSYLPAWLPVKHHWTFTICSMMYTTSFMAKRSIIYFKTSSQTNFMIKTVVSCRSFRISLAQSIETSSGEASHSWNRSRRAERRLAQLRHWNPQCSMEYLPTCTPKK